MKTLQFLLIAALCLFLSCKKEAGKVDCWFGLNLPDNYRDSVRYIAINYSDYSDFKNDEELTNPDLFRFSVKTDSISPDYGAPNLVHYGYITLDLDHSYVIKKFTLVDSSGKILFYLPWSSDSTHGSEIPYLPFIFKATGFMSFKVVIYP